MNLRKSHLLIILALLLFNLGCEIFEPDTSPHLSSRIDRFDSSKYTNSYFYNNDNQIIERTLQIVDSETGFNTGISSIFYNYNNNGEITENSSSNGTRIRYSYNNGLISKVSSLNKQGETIEEIFYTYNSEGFLERISGPFEVETYIYEGSNVVEIKTYRTENYWMGVLSSTTYLEYDQMNNPMQNGLPDEFKKILRGGSYGLLGDHNVISETIEYPSGESFTVNYSYEYNDESYPTLKISSNGDSTRYTYIDL